MVNVSVVIPTFNEAGNISPLTAALEKALSDTEYEIIFVDDNSPDQTADKIRSLNDFSKRIQLIERKGKLGLSSAVKEGVHVAKGKWILVMDSDLSHSPVTARELLNKKNGYNLVIASRNITGGGADKWPVTRDLISKGADLLCRPLVGNRTSDPLSGFFLIEKDILLKTKIRVKGYKILLNILHDNQDLLIQDVPYVFGPRFSGKTKLDAREIINYLFDLFRIKFR
jgi:dolichol-phosphate mannosyltransferase